MNFSINTLLSPKLFIASLVALSKPSATSSLEKAIRIPFPPPPALAFIITG